MFLYVLILYFDNIHIVYLIFFLSSLMILEMPLLYMLISQKLLGLLYCLDIELHNFSHYFDC